MIKSVHIQNFQGHRDTLIEFHEGLNVIMGSSRSGKSSILRALNWVISNRPTGMGIVSYWAKAKGKVTRECRVTITLSDGTRIARIRGDINGYQINDDKPYEAVETSVPDEVTRLLNFSEINIQKQMDAHFLISQPSGEVSRFFNRILKLEDADKYQSAIESKRRKCNAEIKQLEENIPKLAEDITALDWIDTADRIYGLYSDARMEVEHREENIADIRRKMTDVTEYTEKLTAYKSITDTAERIIERIKTGTDRVQIIVQKNDTVRSAVEQCKNLVQTVQEAEKLSGASSKVYRIAGLMEQVSQKNTARAELASVLARKRELLKATDRDELLKSVGKLIKRITVLNDDLTESRIKQRLTEKVKEKKVLQASVVLLTTQYKEALAEMPNICPLCHQEVKHG